MSIRGGSVQKIIIATFISNKVTGIFKHGERYILKILEYGGVMRVFEADPLCRSSLSYYYLMDFLLDWTDIVTLVDDDIVSKAWPSEYDITKALEDKSSSRPLLVSGSEDELPLNNYMSLLNNSLSSQLMHIELIQSITKSLRNTLDLSYVKLLYPTVLI